jgi:hypothetical protein
VCIKIIAGRGKNGLFVQECYKIKRHFAKILTAYFGIKPFKVGIEKPFFLYSIKWL